MPAALPAAAGALAGLAAKTALPAVASAFAIGATAGSLIVGTVQAHHQQRKSERAAREAYEATLTDRAVMVRRPTEPRKVLYGETVVSGPIVFMESTGWVNGDKEYKDHLHMVIALATHEVEAITDIIINDRKVTAWTADGWADDPAFCKGMEEDGTPTPQVDPIYRVRSEDIVFSEVGETLALAYEVDKGHSATLYWDTGKTQWQREPGADSPSPILTEVPGAAYTVSGNQLTMLDDLFVGRHLVYRYTAASDHAAVVGVRAG